MGEIFIGEAKQFVDLYVNDAYALNKTIKAMHKAEGYREQSN
jgi:hypothetical protein